MTKREYDQTIKRIAEMLSHCPCMIDHEKPELDRLIKSASRFEAKLKPV